MSTKKILIIAAVLLIVVIGALLVYNFYFKTSPTGTSPSPTGSLPAGRITTSALPTSGGQANPTPSSSNTSLASLKLKPISQSSIYAATIGEDGNTVKYFRRNDGHVLQSDFNGLNIKEISSVTLTGLTGAVWSPDKQKVIGLFSDNNQTKKYFYDYANNKSSLLDSTTGYVSWSPDSKKIAYQYVPANGEQNTISVADPDGTNWKNIFKTRLDNLIVEWPAKDKISLRTRVSGLAQGLLYALDPTTGDFNRILSDFYGFSAKWSPKADKLLYSFTTSRGKNPSLTLADSSGANTKDLKLSGLADKCVWSMDDRTIFCALPQSISSNAIWPDDYYKGLVILSDDFYKINMETNEKTKIAGSDQQFSYDAQDLFLSPKEDYLFFTNHADGLLYSLKI